ncbi:MAG: hypothetical protein M3299_02460 [Thermoproteota archaeon]|nr:hypothetical protein [Thermoproteota archaeon]
MEKLITFLAVAVLISFLAVILQPVLAHEEVVMGDIKIVGGWENEPPLVDQLNAIVLTITQVSSGQPVNNALAQEDIRVQKGAEDMPLNFQPTEEAGTYAATILPTQTGEYALVMQGTITGQAVNGQLEIEDVEDTARFSFPSAASIGGGSSTSSGSSGSTNQVPQGLIEQLQMVIADLTSQVEQSIVVAEEANNSTQSITESIGELKTSADRAYLFSLIGVGAGTAGIAIGVVALSRREKI